MYGDDGLYDCCHYEGLTSNLTLLAYVYVGKVVQQFDYSREADEKDFMCAVASPTGQSVVMGSFNRLV